MSKKNDSAGPAARTEAQAFLYPGKAGFVFQELCHYGGSFGTPPAFEPVKTNFGPQFLHFQG